MVVNTVKGVVDLKRLYHDKCLIFQSLASPGGRWLSHSLLLNGRIVGTLYVVVVVAKEEEVFVLNIVVGLEVLIRFAVAVGWNSCHLCLNSWGLGRFLARIRLGRGWNFFSRAQRISKLRLESQKVLFKLSLTLGIDGQHFLAKFVTSALKLLDYKRFINARL